VRLWNRLWLALRVQLIANHPHENTLMRSSDPVDFGLAVFFDPDKLPRTDLGLEGTPW
jgi:hypothetical protein